MKKPTIKMIAREANVSTATVSRVINNKEPIAEETRIRVNKVIEQLNYQPNQVARSLRTANTKTIALIVSDISNTYFANLSLAVEQTLHNQGYTLIVCSTADDHNKEKSDIIALMEKNVDGFIINTTGKNDELIAEISERVPVVLCNRNINHPDFKGDFIDSNNFKSLKTLTEILLDNNHNILGVINGPLYLSSASERYSGFKAAISNNSKVKYYSYEGNYLEESGYMGAKELLGSSSGITAIVAMNGPIAVGVLKYCTENNINIPEDISIISATDIVNQNLFSINPTTAYMDSKGIGETASEKLIERISDQDIINREIRFESKILIGNSIKNIEK